MMNDLEPVHFKAGEVIFKEGDAPGGVYLISTGLVEISRVLAGEKKVLATLAWSGIFGEMALVDNAPRAATATALTDTWCHVMDRNTFEANLKRMHPFMRGIVQALVKTVRNYNSAESVAAK